LTLIHVNGPCEIKDYMSEMIQNLHWLGALCTSEPMLHGSLLLGLFVAGIVGSVAHCAPMCGAFVLGQVSGRIARLPVGQLCERQRIKSGLLLPYHLGRLTTYAALGATGSATLALGQTSLAWHLSTPLLIVAAMLCVVHGFGGTRTMMGSTPRTWSRLIGTMTRRIDRGTPAGEYLLGLALGFLPCGLLYAALAAAASTGQPVVGMAAMVAFGLGTIPMLVIIGIAGQAAGRRWNRSLAAMTTTLMMLNAGVLLALAWQHWD
jgi:uncharacterized protein